MGGGGRRRRVILLINLFTQSTCRPLREKYSVYTVCYSVYTVQTISHTLLTQSEPRIDLILFTQSEPGGGGGGT